MIRLLPPFRAKIRKRLTKSPRLDVKDTGILHAFPGVDVDIDEAYVVAPVEEAFPLSQGVTAMSPLMLADLLEPHGRPGQ